MTKAGEIKARLRAAWGGAAEAWERRFDWYARTFAPMMTWCCDRAALAPGQRVLDVACGTGLPALVASRRVAPGGRVTGVDLAPQMLAAAGRRARAHGIDNVEFLEMDAERLHFPDASFDAVTCATGLMFFPDAVGALKEMRRVLRQGGRLAVAVWDDPAKSSFLTLAGLAVGRYFPPTPPDPKTPGAFRFSKAADLEAVIAEAGFSEVSLESVGMLIEYESVATYWEDFTDMAAGIKEKVGALAAHDRAELERLVAEAAEPHVVNGRLRLTATPLCASAVNRPGS
jgi:SAM-dependent methyltransferase